jgi:hypothetical protein
VWLDHAPCAARAVGHRARDRQPSAAADRHALYARVPAGDHLTLAELELERLAAVPRCVELLARAEGDADVVHRDLLAARRLGSVADDEVFDAELERDVTFGFIDVRAFESQSDLTLT